MSVPAVRARGAPQPLPLLDIRVDADRVSVSIARALDASPGVALRADECRRQVLRGLGRLGAGRASADGDEMFVRCRSGRRARIADVVARLERRIAELADRPLPGSLVEAALGITPAERVAWTRDGRLPRQGTGFMRRGQPIPLYGYPVAAIARLIAEPAIVAGWRMGAGSGTVQAAGPAPS
ncbi:hypothetical protein STVA_15350 [Allostella vacuolata]|nr:hypothetical protein STVA_15350 [Stella vacuolata]